VKGLVRHRHQIECINSKGATHVHLKITRGSEMSSRYSPRSLRLGRVLTKPHLADVSSRRFAERKVYGTFDCINPP
jgi:hypothetical protein